MNQPEPSSRKHNPEDDKKRQEQSRRQFRFWLSYLITSLIVLWLFQALFLNPLTRSTEIPYNEFKKKLADAQIVKATIGQRGIVGEMKNPGETKNAGDMKNPKPDGSPSVVPFNTIPAPAGDPKLIEELQNANVTYQFERPPSALGGILLNLLPLLVILWIVFS